MKQFQGISVKVIINDLSSTTLIQEFSSLSPSLSLLSEHLKRALLPERGRFKRAKKQRRESNFIIVRSVDHVNTITIVPLDCFFLVWLVFSLSMLAENQIQVLRPQIFF